MPAREGLLELVSEIMLAYPPKLGGQFRTRLREHSSAGQRRPGAVGQRRQMQLGRGVVIAGGRQIVSVALGALGPLGGLGG